jgi:acyl-CoA reductase-like NAD-dependent aldehyde dehydrogenase
MLSTRKRHPINPKSSVISYAPTVLLNPAKDAKVSTQEVFAPVVCIYGYKTLEEAIEQANSLEVSFQSSSQQLHLPSLQFYQFLSVK